MANLLSSFLNGSSTLTYNNGTNVIPSYTLVQPTFSNTSTGASIFNQTFGSSSSFGNSLLFGSSLGGSTLTGSFGNSFNVGGFNTSFNYGSLGNGFGFGTIARTSTTPTTTTSGTTIAYVQVDEDSDVDFAINHFDYADGSAAASMMITALPENGTLTLDNGNDPVSLNEILTSSQFDDLTYEPDPYFDGVDSFSVKLSTDGSTYDTTNSIINLTVLGHNDDPTIDTTSVIAVTEGSTASNVGSLIVGSFNDPDTGDALDEVTITSIPAVANGKLQYTSDAGGTITISTTGVTLSATETNSLMFVAESNVAPTNNGANIAETVGYSVSDGNGGTATGGSISLQITDGNDAPTFVTGYATNAFEPTENSIYVNAGTNPATDEETNYTLTYSVTGTDAALFNVDSSNGALTFRSAPDYEDPDDSNKDNLYVLNMIVTDDAGATDTVAIEVDVQPEHQTLDLASSSATINEGDTVAMTAVLDIADTSNDVSISIGTGNDSDLFEIDNNGVISFIEAPDLEATSAATQYTLDVILTDNDELDNGEPKAETITVLINVDDIHDESPELIDTTPITLGSTITVNSGSASFTGESSTGNLSLTVDEELEVTEDSLAMSMKFNNGEASTALTATPDLAFALTSSAGTSNFDVSSTTSSGVVTASINLIEGADLDHENPNYSDGELTLTLTVTDMDDGTTAETEISVSVEGVNEPPVYSEPLRILNAKEGSPVNIGGEMLENLSDPEEDVLIFRVEQILANVGSLSYEAGNVEIPISAATNSAGTSHVYLTVDQIETLTFTPDETGTTSNYVQTLNYDINDSVANLSMPQDGWQTAHTGTISVAIDVE